MANQFQVKMKKEFGKSALSVCHNGYQWESIIIRDPVYEIPHIIEVLSRHLTAVQADAKSCPLYVDYKKSCKAWRDREEELNRTA
jgi:hypothetical protein